jgi:hypothetical protein
MLVVQPKPIRIHYIHVFGCHACIPSWPCLYETLSLCFPCIRHIKNSTCEWTCKNIKYQPSFEHCNSYLCSTFDRCLLHLVLAKREWYQIFSLSILMPSFWGPSLDLSWTKSCAFFWKTAVGNSSSHSSRAVTSPSSWSYGGVKILTYLLPQYDNYTTIWLDEILVQLNAYFVDPKPSGPCHWISTCHRSVVSFV